MPMRSERFERAHGTAAMWVRLSAANDTVANDTVVLDRLQRRRGYAQLRGDGLRVARLPVPDGRGGLGLTCAPR
jgi:hypothetical protein